MLRNRRCRGNQGQALVEMQNERAALFVVRAPYDGQVSKCFVDPGEEVRLGETVVDLHVAKDAMHHGEEAEHA